MMEMTCLGTEQHTIDKRCYATYANTGVDELSYYRICCYNTHMNGNISYIMYHIAVIFEGRKFVVTVVETAPLNFPLAEQLGTVQVNLKIKIAKILSKLPSVKYKS